MKRKPSNYTAAAEEASPRLCAERSQWVVALALLRALVTSARIISLSAYRGTDRTAFLVVIKGFQKFKLVCEQRSRLCSRSLSPLINLKQRAFWYVSPPARPSASVLPVFMRRSLLCETGSGGFGTRSRVLLLVTSF